MVIKENLTIQSYAKKVSYSNIFFYSSKNNSICMYVFQSFIELFFIYHLKGNYYGKSIKKEQIYIFLTKSFTYFDILISRQNY